MSVRPYFKELVGIKKVTINKAESQTSIAMQGGDLQKEVKIATKVD